MSKKDAVKSKINAFIVAMGLILTALFAVIGYAFVTYETISFTKWCVAFASMIALIVAFCIIVWLISKEIKRLEKRNDRIVCCDIWNVWRCVLYIFYEQGFDYTRLTIGEKKMDFGLPRFTFASLTMTKQN